MKKSVYTVFIGLCLFCAATATANGADDFKTRVKGKWEVSLPILPGADQKFILDIREKDKAIVFDILNVDELDIKEMRFIEKNGKLSANLYIGDFIKLVIWEENNVIIGVILTPMFGDIPVGLKKI